MSAIVKRPSSGSSGSGTVTSVSVVSANGFAGSVANSTTTPAITITTTVNGILQGNGTSISAASTTGTGSVVLATSPTLVTPSLGVAVATSINKVSITTPATSATLTIADTKTLTVNNSLTFSGVDGSTVLFSNGGTVVYAANNLSVFASTTSAQLAGIISDETGSGSLVFATSPILITPNIGVATATSVVGIAGTSTLRTGVLDTNDFRLQAYDVNDATYRTFIVLTAGNTPSMAIGASVGVASATMDNVVIGGTTAAAGTFTSVSTSGVLTFSANSTITSGSYQIGRNGSSQFVFNSPGLPFVFTQSGTQCLFMDNFQYNFTQAAATGGTFSAVRVTGGAHTGLTASTENIDVQYALNRTIQFSTGALATQRAVYVAGQTIAFVAASTVTNAITLDVDSPVAGTNATITNNFAARFNGGVAINTSAVNTISLQNTAVIAVTASDTSATLRGNRSAGSSLSDVIINSAATRTAGNIFSVQNNGTAQFLVGYAGTTSIQGSAQSSGVIQSLLVKTANHTGQTASTEVQNFQYSTYTRTWAAGAITTQREIIFNAPTYAFASASTITTAATFVVSGAPIAGTNATITTSLALWIQAGTSRFDASVIVHGATATPAGGTTGAGLMFSSTANLGVFWGSGAPSLSAAQGSLYLRTDGSGMTDRAYINTNGSTTWTAVMTVS